MQHVLVQVRRGRRRQVQDWLRVDVLTDLIRNRRDCGHQLQNARLLQHELALRKKTYECQNCASKTGNATLAPECRHWLEPSPNPSWQHMYV